MKKKLIIGLILCIAMLGLTGCGAKPISESKNNTYYMRESTVFDFYVDKETCVEYIVFRGYNKGNVISRLNIDGTIKLNENCLKKN